MKRVLLSCSHILLQHDNSEMHTVRPQAKGALCRELLMPLAHPPSADMLCLLLSGCLLFVAATYEASDAHFSCCHGCTAAFAMFVTYSIHMTNCWTSDNYDLDSRCTACTALCCVLRCVLLSASS